MADGGRSSTLRFTCDACGTHLGVDESLAGLEAPCPKCGAILVAPNPRGRESRLPSSGVVRGISGGAGGGFQVDSRERADGRSRISSDERASRGRSRKIYPAGGAMPNEDEKSNLKVLLRILIATALVVFVVVLVTWFLKNQ